MGVGFGLVQGLVKGATGIQEGKARAKELEQKALHDALAQSLLKAQIQKLNTPPVQQDEWTYHYDSETGSEARFNPRTGERVLLPTEGGRGKREQPKKAPVVTPGSPEDLKILKDQAAARAAGAPDRPQSQAEVAAQDQLPIIEESYRTLEDIEDRDPAIGNRVIAKANKARQLSVPRVLTGIIGKMSGQRNEDDMKAMTEESIVNSLTDEEKQWYAASKGYLSGVLPALGGKALTITEVLTHGGPMFSTGNESPQSLQQKRAARRARYEATVKRGGGTPQRRPAGSTGPSDRGRSAVARLKAKK